MTQLTTTDQLTSRLPKTSSIDLDTAIILYKSNTDLLLLFIDHGILLEFFSFTKLLKAK